MSSTPASGRISATRSNDPRATRSREALRAALLGLIQQGPFDAITLRDVAKEAGVSYPTIFAHYPSKDDLFQDVAHEAIMGLLAAFGRGRTRPGWRPGRDMAAFVDQHRDLWRILLTAGASEVMRSAFIRRGRELVEDRADLGHGVPYDVVSGVIASGTFEVVAWWLSRAEQHPAAMVGDTLERLVIEPALDLPRGHFAAAAR